MKVLLIGGAGAVENAILDKLNKEGHRTYVLTGNKYKKGSYHAVYEKYSFEYENDCIKEIFDSIDPDVVIFTGAFDSNFDWHKARKETVRYSAGLLNTLIAFVMLKHGRFIYLSSEEVYGESYPNDIMEDEPATPESFRAMALAQGEAVCLNYQKTMQSDIVILRIDHLVYIPKKKKDVNERCAKMCLEALKSGTISVNSKNIISMLFLTDAVEFIYQIVAAGKSQHALYHISSCDAVNEMQLARWIVKEMEGTSIVDNTIGTVHRVVLSNRQFEKEFSGNIFHHKEMIVQEVAQYMQHHKNRFIEEEDKGTGFVGRIYQRVRLLIHTGIPYIENLLCFIPFFMMNNRAVGSEYFANLDIYLIYVLLFAIIYGQQQATFSAILAVAGYCFRQMYNRSGFEVMIDYNTYIWIGHLFIFGLVVGYMKDRLKAIAYENDAEVNYLSDQLYDIQDINSMNVRMKNMLETQVINQNESIGKVYEIISTLDKYEPAEVLFYAAEVLSHLIDSKDVAIYTIERNGYARIISATSSKARELGNSIRYRELEDMYGELRKRQVFINKRLDERYPLMANAIYSEENMQLILMVWGLPLERMTLSQANKFVVIGYLIQNALVRANRYMEALENERYIKDTEILEKDAFKTLAGAYISARQRGLTVCSLLKVEVPDGNYEHAGSILVSKLRKTDYLGKLEDGELYVLLSNTEENGAEYVMRRFHEVGYSSTILEELNV